MGLKSWFKRNASRDVGIVAKETASKIPGVEATKRAVNAVDDWTATYTPTMRRAGSAAWEGSKAAAGMAGLAIAGGIRKGSKSLLQLAGRFTWLFALLAAGLHFMLILNIPSISVGGFSSTVSSFLDVFTDLRFVLYVFLAVLASVLFYADNTDSNVLQRFVKFFGLTVAAYLLPIILHSIAITSQGTLLSILDTLASITALWLFFTFSDPGDKITVIFSYAYYLLLVAFLLSLLFSALANSERASQTDAQTASWEYWKSQWFPWWSQIEKLPEKGKDAIGDFRKGWNSTINRTTQDFYVGQVDQSNKDNIPLGVFIEQPQSDYRTVYLGDGDDVTASAVLKARSLIDDTIVVYNGCRLQVIDQSDPKNYQYKNITGRVEPPVSRFVYSAAYQDKQDIQCIINNADVKQLLNQDRLYTGTVVFNSTFNFTTLSYMPYAFMEHDLYIAMRQNKLDPATEMGVQQSPIAKYTPGPVMIGMARDTQPFAFTPGEDPDTQLPAFGITFSSATLGKGKLLALHELHLLIPQQFEFNRERCTPNWMTNNEIVSGGAASSVAWSENPYYWDYKIKNPRIQEGDTFLTIRCPLIQNKKGPGANLPILGPAGASLFTFYAQANYTYVSEARTTVTMKGVQQTATAGTTDTQTSGGGTATQSGVTSTSGSSTTSTTSGYDPSVHTTPASFNSACMTDSCSGTNQLCTCYVLDGNQQPTQRCQWYKGLEQGRDCRTV